MLAGQLGENETHRQLALARINDLFAVSEQELKHSISDIDADHRTSIIEEALEQIGLYQRIIEIEFGKSDQLGIGSDDGLYADLRDLKADVREHLKGAYPELHLALLETWPDPEQPSLTGDALTADTDPSPYFDPIRKELVDAGVSAALIAEVEEHTGAYFSKLAELQEVHSSLEDLRRTSADLFLGLIFLVDDLRAEALDRAENARREYDTIRGQMVRIMLIAVSIVAIGSILSGYLLGKRLSRRISAIAETSRKMAEGKTGVSIPYMDSKNEIGDMAHALKAFSDTAEELRDLNRDLEKKIAERTKQLEIQTQRAEESSKAKSAFLAHMSHEIRTPMNGVVGMVEILSTTDLTDGQRKLLETINESADHLLRVIDDILDVSKIEAGKLDLEEMNVDLLQLIERTMETFSQTARANNVRLLNYCEASMPEYVVGDPVRLRQIILNLVGNAVKFSKRTGDEIGIVEVHSSIDEHGDFRLRVVDNGIGMSQQTIDGLFTSFQQADTSTTRNFGGTGLGMKITSRLVAMMGGSIDVESTMGEGTVFTVHLPLKEAKKRDAGINLSGVHMLVYFERPKQHDYFERFFAGHGASMEVAADKADFLSRLKNAKDDPIAVIGCDKASDNDANLAEIRDQGLRTRVMILDPGRQSAKGLVRPDTYISHRYPVHFTDILNGITALKKGSAEDISPSGVFSSEGIDGELEEIGAAPVLLCEDNTINQKVLARQLEMLGYPYEIADNGKEGLEKWETGRYGLILTDCQMPEMDGYALTAAIRERELERGLKRTTIIAVTANALKGEAEACVSAGMDGYLSKPVKLDELKETLGTWYRPRGEAVEKMSAKI